MKNFLFIFILFVSIGSFSQVGIGTSNPNASAKLDISSTNKGFLPPRVALTASNAAAPITTPATGLLVYNTASVADVMPGYYYNSGTSSAPLWLRLNTNADFSGTNTALYTATGNISQNFLVTFNTNGDGTVINSYSNTGQPNQFPIIGIATNTATNGTSVKIQMSGIATCTFDNASYAGDYVQQSSTHNGMCTDVGPNYPTSGQVLGVVLANNSTNNNTTNLVYLTGPEIYPTLSFNNASGLVIGNGTSAMTALAGANSGETINWNATSAAWQITGTSSLALGNGSGATNQKANSVAIGNNAAASNQEGYSIAIGSSAGNTSQQAGSVAIGNGAGRTNQGTGAIAMGAATGYTSQGNYTVALGSGAGNLNQGYNSIAIGPYAGNQYQGTNAVALGYNAGPLNQASNSIVLNATGSALDAANSGFFVGPIRSLSNSTNLLTYNNTTNEISYNTNKTFVINHPTKPDSYLVHACLEGPEAGVYYRGEAKIENNQSVTVKLPDYVSAFASNFSIQITPIYTEDSNDEVVYKTSRVKDNAFTVHGKNGSFYWIVYGQRGKVEVEPKKSEVQVGGDGPYKYIKSKK